LLERDDALVGVRGRDAFAVGALGFAREPFQEGGRVGYFAFGFGEGLAVLEGEDQGEVVDVLDWVGGLAGEIGGPGYSGLFTAEVGPLAEPARTLAGSRFLVTLEGSMRGEDGGIGIGSVHFGTCCLREGELSAGPWGVGARG
jgi:hypothetical protein